MFFTKLLSKNTPTTKRKKQRVFREKHLYFFFCFLCLSHTVLVGGLLFLLNWLAIPDLDSVLNYAPAQSTIIYDSEKRIVDRMYTENRTVISLQEMPQYLPLAFVAAEDGSFFTHKGVDLFSILRALVNNMRREGNLQGGSTITQQVTKSLLLSSEKTYLRKIREAILAWRIDRVVSKEEILHIYLNQIYLGEGAHGVESAAQVYFGKPASHLNLSECALLAGLPQAPSRYSLFAHQGRASERQRYVLNRMVADGYISADVARHAYEQKVRLSRKKQLASEENGYYLQEVKKQARKILGQPLQRAGVQIYTCLDSRLQAQTQQILSKRIAAFWQQQKRKGIVPDISPQAAIVAMESSTGKVRAIVGGSSFALSPYNRAVQARRPAGSTFKPFIYSAALEQGWTPSTTIEDSPLTIRGAKGRAWSPENYDRRYMGEVSLQTALTYSLNTASVRLMSKTGYRDPHKIARAAGISAQMPKNLSLSLGAVDVSLFELTGAYTIFADNGIFHPPRLIEKIVLPSGRVVYPNDLEPVRVLSPATAKQMQVMLASVVQNGTGRVVRDVTGVQGGKTGTSDKSRDAWFIGYNKKYTTGVWVGYDRNQSMGQASGGKTAGPIWQQVMLSIQ